jgi:hypothetical protein
MAFDPNKPANNTPLNSTEMRAQLNALKALIDGLLPIGIIVGWAKSRANMPALPGTWVECNGQTLNDPQSPFHGQVIDDLNGAGGPQRFLRGAAASGGTGGADTHAHDIDLQIMSANTADGGDHTSVIPTVYTTTGPNPASSALPSYYEVVWVIRVK